MFCLDRLPEPDPAFFKAQKRLRKEHEAHGSLHYRQMDVTDTRALDELIGSIADQHGGIDGAILAAGVQKLCPAVDYTAEDARHMLDVNFTGVMMTATACGRAMLKHKTRGSIVLIGSMSGLIANRGFNSVVYNASKAAVIQLGRNLAMEWGRVRKDGSGGIRVNVLSPGESPTMRFAVIRGLTLGFFPGNIVTPMVLKNFEEVPGLKEQWENDNMLGRLADPADFRGVAVFLLSKASRFMSKSSAKPST